MFDDDRSFPQRNVTDTTSRGQGQQLEHPKEIVVGQRPVNKPFNNQYNRRERHCPLYNNNVGHPDSHAYFAKSVAVNSQQVHLTRELSTSYERPNQANPPRVRVVRPSVPQLSNCSVPAHSRQRCCYSFVAGDVHATSFDSCSWDASLCVANKAEPSTSGCFGFSDVITSPSCVQGCEHCSVGIKDNSVNVYYNHGDSGISDYPPSSPPTPPLPPPPLPKTSPTPQSVGVGCFEVTQASCYHGYGHRCPVGLQETSGGMNLHCRHSAAVISSNPPPPEVGCFEVAEAPCYQGYDHVCHAHIESQHVPPQAGTANSLAQPYSPGTFKADDALSGEIGPLPSDTGVNASSPNKSEGVQLPNDSKNLHSSSKHEIEELDKAACDAAEMFDALMAYSPTESVNSDTDDKDADDVKTADKMGFVVDENVFAEEEDVNMEDTPGYLVDELRAETTVKLDPNSEKKLLNDEETSTPRYPQQKAKSSLLPGDRKIIVSLTQLRKLFGEKCKTDDCLTELCSVEETDVKGCVVEFHWKCAAGHQGVWATDESGSDVYGCISGAGESPPF